MKQMKRVLFAVGCIALLLASYAATITSKSDAEKQLELMEQADQYLQDEVYIRAIPLLETATAYRDEYTLQAEETLKGVYLKMIQKSGYARKYTDLLDKQMARKDAAPEVFLEAASYYLKLSRYGLAFSVLKDGIEKTGSQDLVDLYEANRYQYTVNRDTYQDVTAIYNGAIQVKLDGFWGLANARGNLLIPCEYDQVSTFSEDRAIVRKGKTISAVDQDNNRLALLHEAAEEVGSFGGGRVSLRTDAGWQRASGELQVGSMAFEAIGMYSNGYAPAKINGRWGLVDTGSEWLLQPEYDGVIQDELGRCYAQEAVFVKKGDQAVLLVDGQQIGAYEDAKPFQDDWAAVKKDGKWGFIDVDGTIKIDFQFDDALSFGQHLAAVRQGDLWGYVSLEGQVVIEPIFLEAKSFCKGCAPVRDADGWKFITLLEYEEEAGL